jgi:diadenosine tetraphosphate (Ap4A) HIT family hydrolase
MKLTPEEQQKQAYYRDARFAGYYDGIWKSVGKCVFCDLREKYIFHEENGVVMTVNLHAYIDGHTMIIPVKELTAEEWETFRKSMYIAKKLTRDLYGIKGMQILQKDGATAQSTVEHLHFQCIPFDAPDLSQWNYRRLKYTPLENAEIYKQASSTTAKLSKRFDQKYAG